MNRRYFLKSGSIALASLGMSLSAPAFLERVAMGQARNNGKRKTLIAIFQRGAVDGGDGVRDDLHGLRLRYRSPRQAMLMQPSISTGSLDCILR